MGTIGRAVTTSARREKETSNVCGIDVLYNEREGLNNDTTTCTVPKKEKNEPWVIG
jgi:hypothetical protein